MPDINLISPKLAPSGSQKKLVRVLKIISYIITPVVIFAIAGVFVVTVINTTNIKKLEQQKGELIANVKSLEKYEQQYTLVLDRLKKIREIKASASAIDDYYAFEDLTNNLKEGTQLLEASVEKGELSLSFEALSARDLSDIFNRVYVQDLYGQVTLSDFSFRRESGYSFTFDLKKS